jgi:Transposase IS116/IS110/IS902 family
MARGVMRRKIPQLEEALRGHFDDHHGFICATMLRRIDALAADIATLDTKITEQVTPHLEVIERLDEIPGIGARSAEELIAEIGLDMTVFPTAAHLVSWAKFAPIDAQSAGRSKTSTTGKGNHTRTDFRVSRWGSVRWCRQRRRLCHSQGQRIARATGGPGLHTVSRVGQPESSVRLTTLTPAACAPGRIRTCAPASGGRMTGSSGPSAAYLLDHIWNNSGCRQPLRQPQFHSTNHSTSPAEGRCAQSRVWRR